MHPNALPIESLSAFVSQDSVPPAPESRESLYERARFNVAHYLEYYAATQPHTLAIVMPQSKYDSIGKRTYSHLTFHQLNHLCNAYAHGLKAEGLKPGTRVLLMVSQGLELIAITYALFKVGAVPILIDPGMGLKSFLGCVKQVQPEAMIGIPKAFLVRMIFRKAFRTLKAQFVTSSRWYISATSLKAIAQFQADAFPPYSFNPEDPKTLAAILFTSGSTGPPKGVRYTHSIFAGQSHAIQKMYDLQPGDVCVPAFPMFSLFSTSMGNTCIVPDFDPSAPAKIVPEHMIEAIADFGATMAFGSPAVWKRVVKCCQFKEITLPSLDKLLLFGAPIDLQLTQGLLEIAPHAVVHTPYGATESLPMATFDSDQIFSETAAKTQEGKGICVGYPATGVKIRIIAISDHPIQEISQATELPQFEIGEICASGATVTPGYWDLPDADAHSKMKDPSISTGFWHRTGDVGYLDDLGRLWYCGRVSHRVEMGEKTYFTIPCEAILNAHPKVYRSALVPSPDGKSPLMVVELEPGVAWTQNLQHELLQTLHQNPMTQSVKAVLHLTSLPVDRRHNAKIHRPEIAQMLRDGTLKI